MGYAGKDGLLIDQIRRAGLSRVRETALRQGVAPEQWREDLTVLRAVANSSPADAARKCGIGRGAVWYRLTKYAGIAATILDNDRRRGRGDAAGEMR